MAFPHIFRIDVLFVKSLPYYCYLEFLNQILKSYRIDTELYLASHLKCRNLVVMMRTWIINHNMLCNYLYSLLFAYMKKERENILCHGDCYELHVFLLYGFLITLTELSKKKYSSVDNITAPHAYEFL